jgi:hypothetical protein
MTIEKYSHILKELDTTKKRNKRLYAAEVSIRRFYGTTHHESHTPI